MKAAQATILVIAAAILGFGAEAAHAHWDPGDGHKMHFPQLPDPTGWDVQFHEHALLQDSTGQEYFTSAGLPADDWQCSGDGPVTDVHFWVSMRGDTLVANPNGVVPFHVTTVAMWIYDNVPEDPAIPDDYSRPGQLLWEGFFSPGEFEVIHWGSDPQGWYAPLRDEATPQDHDHIYQVNVPDTSVLATEPFVQTEGEIYWLQLDVMAEDPNGNPVDLGWKTSLEHFMDDATYFYAEDAHEGQQEHIREYRELIIDGESRDLAFVITPEPATLALVGLGVAGLLAAERRRRSQQ
jgi:hypothetical protein